MTHSYLVGAAGARGYESRSIAECVERPQESCELIVRVVAIAAGVFTVAAWSVLILSN